MREGGRSEVLDPFISTWQSNHSLRTCERFGKMCLCFNLPRLKLNQGHLLFCIKKVKLSVYVSNYILVATGITWKYWLHSQAPWMCEFTLWQLQNVYTGVDKGSNLVGSSGGDFWKMHLHYKELSLRFYIKGQLKHQFFPNSTHHILPIIEKIFVL